MQLEAKDIMSTDLMILSFDKDINFAEVILEAKHVRHIPVVDHNDTLVGMLSVRDIANHFSKADASHFIQIKNIMSKEVVTASPKTKLSDLAKLMIEKNVGAVPILEGTKIVGMVSERDFLKTYL
jgi:acetoin utilization protein AcuB